MGRTFIGSIPIYFSRLILFTAYWTLILYINAVSFIKIISTGFFYRYC